MDRFPRLVVAGLFICGALAVTQVIPGDAATPRHAATADAVNLVGDATHAKSEHSVTLRYRILFHDDSVDVGTTGPSGGDELVLHDTLVTFGGRTIGHDGGLCTFTDLSVPEASCVLTFSLPGGQVTTQFLNTPPPHKVGAITGGTGKYDEASGNITLTEHRDQTGIIAFHIEE